MHFIRKNVIFDDGQSNGNYPTNRIQVTPTGNEYVTLKITSSLNNMTVEDPSKQVVSVDHSKANILVKKGVIHKIDSVLKYQ